MEVDNEGVAAAGPISAAREAVQQQVLQKLLGEMATHSRAEVGSSLLFTLSLSQCLSQCRNHPTAKLIVIWAWTVLAC